MQRVIVSPAAFRCGVSGLSCKFTGSVARLKALSAACQCYTMYDVYMCLYMCVPVLVFLCVAVQARHWLVRVYVCARLCVGVRSEEEVAVFV